MYIRWYELAQTAALFLPSKYRKVIRNLGYKLKVSQNLKYIKQNKKVVVKKLANKIKTAKLNVVFYIYDLTKWKSQSIYDLMEQSEYFVPYIFVSKNCSPKSNFNYQTKDELKATYDFFKAKGMRVFYAYDFEKDDYIPFDKMDVKPDIIFYSHPWYIYKTQGPVMASKYALTNYIPYFLATSVSPIEYYTRFHLYIENHYVLNDLIKDYYSSKMENHGENLKAVGHPMLDFFYLNKNKTFAQKNYCIYSPHWSVDENDQLHWGTFLELGDFLLSFAQAHPELNWIFKPHPCLANYLRNNRYRTDEQISDYWARWKKIGQVVESGDYLNMFMESSVMITDCGSFETEYFLTQKPLIHLKSSNPTPFNVSVQKIVDTYYEADSVDSLEKVFDEVIIKGNDFKKEERKKVYTQYGYENNYAALNILSDLKRTLGVE